MPKEENERQNKRIRHPVRIPGEAHASPTQLTAAGKEDDDKQLQEASDQATTQNKCTKHSDCSFIS